MKIFKIEESGYTSEVTHVVADSMGDAERIFRSKYPYVRIKSITHISSSVLIQGVDEQAKETK